MKKIAEFIDNKNQQIASLVANEAPLRQIKQALEQIDMFATYRDTYRVIKFAQGILYIGATTAAFATQFRYSASEILRKLQQDLPNISIFSIQCKVISVPKTTQKASPLRKNIAKSISEKTRKRLNALAETLPSSELQQALKRLAIK